jgi:hypothetical protein
MLQPKGEFLWPLFVPMVILLGISLFFIIRNLTFIVGAERTEGTMIGSVQSPSQQLQKNNGGNQTTFREQVEFRTKEGRTVTVLSRTGSSHGLKIGDRVPVYYHPQHPEEKARIAIFRDLWLGPVILGGIGFLFFIMWFGTWIGPPDHPRPEMMRNIQEK